MTAKIKSLALECGFDKVGIVRAEALTHEAIHLGEWLGRGFQGEMRWMERDPAMRSDPRKLFEGARSVVAVAMNYYTQHEHLGEAGTGKVSRYAWGDDYHDVLKERLYKILEGVEQLIPGVKGKVCVDTSPIMDKAWAVKAGLGWLGKHSNVITKDIGSWVFLGELLLDVELEFDTGVVADHCGSCTACLDACPTAAIVEPYVVDSKKCISYATIELRSEKLPAEISENLEGWLYGCDICQDVCPWNRFEQQTDEPRFEPRKGLVEPSAEAILGLDRESYQSMFKGSAIKRTKLDGLKRNAEAILEHKKK